MLKKLSKFLVVCVVIAFLAILIVNVADYCKKQFYPQKYQQYVEMYSEKYDMDSYLIYAVIKTESNFDEQAESNVGARGLMQLMNDAFDWVKYRMSDERVLTYDDMYNPEYNIEYGTYMLKLLTDEYKDYETALAAYHAGRTSVNNWLADTANSADGKTLSEIPSQTTKHYVQKVMKAYEAYSNLYN